MPPDAMPQSASIPPDTYGMFLFCTVVSALECGSKAILIITGNASAAYSNTWSPVNCRPHFLHK
jgi:hypothetical protein